jgi:hypothetical protein
VLLKAQLEFETPESLRRVLGDGVGARIEFELAVAHPRKAVSVAPPTNALPPSAFPGG